MTVESDRRPTSGGVGRDLAVGLAIVVAVTCLAVELASLTLPDIVEIVVLVTAVAAAGWFWGRAAGLMGAISASVWFAVALTDPPFEANVENEQQVQLALLLIVVSVLAAFAGDLVRERSAP